MFSFLNRLISKLTYQMQLDILDVLPLIVILSNVWKIHSSAGISRNFVAYSCASAAFFLISATSLKRCFTTFVRFIVALLLFCSIRYKFPLKSDKFRDPKWTPLIVPLSIVLSLFSFIDRGTQSFLENIGYWFNTFAIACQVAVTKQSRRITLLSGFLPVFFICKFGSIYLMFSHAFITSSGTDMWYSWLNGATSLVLAIDFFYFAYNAKQRIDDFELPSGQFNDFE